ncbi:MAG: sigma-54 dependent transcriptional regulator, partial [Desulfobacteraceae bacterium]|nr:sigma-54 dependent transcriptional regulator [Desulfobacteraceae bacterium]
TIGSAVQAMKEGVTNYLIKPLNYEELSVVLERAIREKEISRQLAELRQEVKEKYSFQNIIGSGQKMRDIFEMLRAVAPTDASILIQGETGTGKELLAKAIHSLSRRQNRNMVCINSAALAESLLEAELFGYVKGAFTGAVTNKKGRFESADGGTLFLDEIGQTSLKFQSKLLRFLQEGTFEPVGSVESRRADVRVITASNRILQEEIKAGRFLSDLYYRIEVISITLPPLRERRDDIPLLVNHFIKRYAKQYEKAIDGIHPQAIDALLHHEWPGNVRELENCIARAVILCKEHNINTGDLPEKIRILNNEPSSLYEEGLIRSIPEQGLKIKEMERELILKTIEKCEGNKSLTANLLGISRKALYEKIERHGIGI